MLPTSVADPGFLSQILDPTTTKKEGKNLLPYFFWNPIFQKIKKKNFLTGQKNI
jgi:hypothetical protein